MYFNRKNAAQKNWRMIKKGKHFLFGCSLVFAVGATLVTPTVKADTVAGKGEVETTTTNSDSKASPDEEVGTYKAPATVAAQPAAVEEAVVAEKPTVKVVNKEALTQLVTEVKGLDKAGKTEDSLSRLNTALEQAQNVLENAEASQDQVDAAVASLKEAVAQLAAKEEKAATVATEEKTVATEEKTVATEEKTVAAEEKTEATEDKAVPTDETTEVSATQPKSRSRRAAGQERSMEGRDIKYVWQNRQATLNGGEPTQRAKIEYRQLDDYEVVNGKTVATDPSGQGRPVLEWTVTFNEAQYDKPGGYWYFTIPKNVSDPYNVVTDYDGVYINRYGWKDANKESGAGAAGREGVQYIDAGNKLEMRVKNSTGSRDYNKVDGLSGVMGDSKKVYVLQTSIYSGVRKFTVRYRTVVEDPSQTISYLAGVESSGNLPRFNWNVISGKYDKHLVSQVATPSVTPNLTNTSVNVPVQTVASTSSTLSGTGTPGATIKLYIDGREQNIGNVTVDGSGNWTTGELPTALNNNQGDGTTIKPRQTVQVSQTVNGTESSRRTVPVSVGVTTVDPSSLTTNQDAVVAGQKEVTLKVPHDAGIAYMRYTNTAGQAVEIPVKRDNASSAWVSQKSDKATVKSYEHGKFEDTIVLTMADKIAGTEVSAISNVTDGGFSSVAGWQPRGVENQAPTIASAVEGNRKTVTQGAQLDLASLVTVADKEDDAQATLGDKVHAEVVSVNGNAATKTVDTNTQGTYTVKYKAVDSQGKESGEIEVTVVVEQPAPKETVRPVLNIPYDDADNQAIYVYSGETNNIELKVTDNSGKIVKAYLAMPADNRQGLGTEDTSYLGGGSRAGLYLKADRIKTETEATETTPAVIHVTGEVPANTYTEQNGQFTRYLFAEDAAGNTAYEHVGAPMDKGALGRIRFMWKPQTFKYTATAPTTPLVGDNAPTAAELEQAVKSANPTFSDKIKTVAVNGDKVIVTYNDGSTDELPKDSVFKVRPAAPVVTPTIPATANNMPGAGVSSTDKTISGTGTPGATVTIKSGDNTLVENVPVGADGTWTATLPKGLNSNITTQPQLTSKEKVTVTQTLNGVPSAETEVPVGLGETTIQPDEKSSDKQSIVEGAETITVKVPHDAGMAYLGYTNKDTNKAGEVALKRDSIDGPWYAKDESKAVVKSYATDGFTDTIVLEMKEPVKEGKAKAIANIVEGKYSSPVGWKEINVERDTTAPEKPEITTDLKDKAGTQTPVTVNAEKGSHVVLYDQANNVIGEGDANEQGVVEITPTKPIPEGNVTAKATDKSGNTSLASDPKVATTKETVRPVLNIPYDDVANQAIYVYSGETNNIELKVTDNSGKIVKAYLAMPADNRQGLGTEDTSYLGGGSRAGLYLKADRIKTETEATETTPAVIHVTGEVPANTYTEQNGQFTRYLFAEDAAGNTAYEHVGAPMDKGALGRIRFMWKPQTFKYTATAPTTPLVGDNAPTAAELEQAVKSANPTFSDKIKTVAVNGDKVIVTYNDGSTDELPKDSVFKVRPVAPVVTPTIPATANNMPGAGVSSTDKTISGTGTPGATVTIKSGDNTLVENVPVGADGTWTATLPKGLNSNITTQPQLTSKEKVTVTQTLNGVPSAETEVPVGLGETTIQPDEKSSDKQSLIEGTKTITVKVPHDAGMAYLGYTNKDTNKAGEVALKRDSIDGPWYAKDESKAVVKSYATDGFTDTIVLEMKEPVKEGKAKAIANIVEGKYSSPVGWKEINVERDTTTPAKPSKPVVSTDLTGKAGTKTPVEVTAEPGSTVELFDKDGNKIGEATAGTDGKATITPTVDIPEGNVTAKATKDGQTSDASAPKEATAATPAKPSTPVVDTDLTGKAGTKTPVEVTAEPGTKVELFDKDGNKIGEGVADENGKAKITPTVDIPEGNVTAKATKDGQTSDASAPKEATAATPAKPSTPVVDTD
ncbi:Ig-like domain-containing protein, partial [Streptococcus infantis]|uniref:Ig-like domain-containing protein n=1 Tax=Streptococcus infantis TaxID=68892 RepID=UPI0039C199DF